jgi:ABC-type multidrug transport system fused ATPase/permease subunit
METNIISNIKSIVKNKIRNRKIKSYYIEKIKDGKTYNAVVIDSLFFKIIFIFLIFIYLFILTTNIPISLIITILISILYFYVSYKIKKKRLDAKIFQINEEIIKKKLLRKISTMSNIEFVEFAKCILEKYYDTSFIEYKKAMDMIGKIGEDIYGIKCFKCSQDERINANDIRTFIGEIDKLGIENGIVVTNSYFAADIKDDLILNRKIIFVDFNVINNITKEIGMNPNMDEIEEMILNSYQERKKNITKIKGHFFSKDKILKFYFLSFILFLMSSYTKYGFYYKVVSIITFVFASISAIYSFYSYIKLRKEKFEL